MTDSGESSRLLSPALIAFLRRRVMELSGVALIFAGLALTATLFSPGRYDPSLSAYSTGAIDNWFGATGAVIAGALRTSLGTASFFATILPVGWGYRLLRKQAIGQRVARLFLAPVALLFLASGLYGLSGGDGSASGGAAGVVLLGLTMPHLPPVTPLLGIGAVHYLGAAYAVLGLMLWSWSATLSRRQWAILLVPARLLWRLVASAAKPGKADADGDNKPELTLTEPPEQTTDEQAS